ncbi:thioredoxin [Oesophagostomum dentatum]|uniref:protein-disulfide reductase n=2 Tax=Oesophagostomum dentatum TaxID=61180 RepID=A0A0B1SLE5_OESDE|nr:thioredoxin [Oesophagostomum dentatum]
MLTNFPSFQDKVVGLYFSAHWCPPCRQFTPVLKDFHGELADDGEFEIVFVSFDRSESDLKKYMEECHGDWYCIPFGSPKIQELATKYSVSGIPALIIIKADGKEITKNGRGDVQSKAPKAALSAWKSA